METVGLKLDIQAPAQSIKDLKAEIKNVNSEMLRVKEGSSAYQDLARRAGEAKERIKDLKDATNLFTRGGTVAEIANVGQTIAGGFAAAQGAMALFGGATEDVQKQLLKIQAGIAIVEGIKGAIAGWESVQRLLNVAMAANPIGLFIAAATALGAVITGLVTSMNSAIGKASEHYDAMVMQQKASEELLKAFDREERKLRALGVAEDEIIEKRKQATKAALEQALQTAQAAKNLADETAKDFGKGLGIGAAVPGLTRALQFLGIVSDEGDLDKAVEKVKETGDKVEELNVKILELDKKKDDIIIKRATDRQKSLDEIKFEGNPVSDDGLDLSQRTKLTSEEIFNNQLFDLTFARLNYLESIDKEFKDRELAREKALQDAKFQIAQAGSSALGSLSQLAQQGSDASRAFALGQIAVDTGLAFMKAYTIAQESATLTGPAAAFTLPVFYATQIASVLSAAAKAKSILGASAGSISAPSLNSGSSARPPQINNVGTNVTNVGTDNNGDYNGKQSTNFIKAYVVESDITSSQKNIASIVKKSKIE